MRPASRAPKNATNCTKRKTPSTVDSAKPSSLLP